MTKIIERHNDIFILWASFAINYKDNSTLE